MGNPTRRARILLADDTAVVRAMGRDAMEALDLEVLEAGDGANALARFREDRPDAVLLDVNMPEHDGYAVCREIRRDPAGVDTPILMMTASEEVEAVRRAYAAGATDFTTKPVNWAVVAQRVLYMLRMGRMVGELRESREELAEAQHRAHIGNFELDPAGIVRGSPEFWRLYGLMDDGAIDLPKLVEQVHPDERETLLTALERCRLSGEPLQLDHRVGGDASADRYIHLRAEIRAVLGRPARLCGTAQDVTERRRSEEEIRFLAFHDGLTRLGNRRHFTERLRFALSQLRRSKQLAAVLFLDLDHFKRVNDTLGHEAGDQFLIGVADRLRHCVRDSDCVSRDLRDPLSPTVSRFGGDEFLIALCGIESPAEAMLVAQRILDQLDVPLQVGDELVPVSASIGIALAPQDGRDVDTLIRNADAAMYHAKHQGRGRARFYDAAVTTGPGIDFQLETDLRLAVDNEQFFVHYQPTVQLSGGRVTGFEALVRWNHPTRGVVPPDDFIPIAEAAGLVDRIGEGVLRTVCQQLRKWEDAGCPGVRVAVNVSPRQLAEADFPERVKAIMAESGIRGSQLDLELTETALVEHPAQVVAALETLKGIGLRVSLDDFGTGCSSLSHLKGFPLDTVKIDRSFVKDLPDDRDDVAVTEAILSMASALGLRVVAEGVETAEQLEFLRERGCAEAQGFFLRAPISADDATELLQSEPVLLGGEKPRD